MWLEKRIRDIVKAGMSHQYLINPPDQIYSPIIDNMCWDDEGSPAAAQTRLGEPSVRVALLEQAETDALQPYIQVREGKQVIKSLPRDLAEMVQRWSVSVPTRKLDARDISYINGTGLLSGYRIYPAINREHISEKGKRIRFDPELGLVI